MPALTERDERATDAVAPTLAAGVIFAAPDGSVLLLCRSDREANYAGHWSLPGGKGDAGETAWMTACRETDEEIGSLTRHAWVGEPTIVDEAVTPTGMVFTTFVQPVRYRFVPELNAEHAGFVWAMPGAFPAPMHPQVARVLGEMFPESDADVDDFEFSEMTGDASWSESDHPRASNGEFGSGGGGSSSASEKAEAGKSDLQKSNEAEHKKLKAAHESLLGKLSEAQRQEFGKGIEHQQKLEADRSKKSDALNAIPGVGSGRTGMTPDDVKEKPEYKKARAEFEEADKKYKDFNQKLSKFYGKEVSSFYRLERYEKLAARASDSESFALDRATVRSKDADGHLRVERTPITRAVVSPYYGSEIPNSAALGLDPERVYQVYRDATELLAAADTFIGKPVLSEHKASSAENHPRHLTVGAIGGPIDMQGDTLYAPLTIWDKDAIDEIESEEKRNLSCSYRYRYDPTPGKAPDGTPFDGSMKEIIGNHIALVEDPRVPGSMVADNLPAGLAATIPNSGLPAGGFKRAAAPERKEPDMADKTAKDRAKDESDILAGIKEKLSDDECKALDDMLMAGKANDADKDDEPEAKKADDAETDMADKDKKADDEDDKVTKEAMDSALRLAMDAERKHQSDAREAERFVRPWIGEINLAMDASASDIYKTAIEGMGRKVDCVHPSAYRAILEMIPKPGQRQPTTRVAMDSASMSGFAARHPDAARIKLNVVR